MTDISQDAVELPASVRVLNRVRVCGTCHQPVTIGGGHIHDGGFSGVYYENAVSISALPAIRAQVLAEVRERLEALRQYQFGEFDGPWLKQDDVLAVFGEDELVKGRKSMSSEVPESVLDAFFGAHTIRKPMSMALSDALDAYDELLKGDEAQRRASGVVAQSHPKTKAVGRVVSRQVVQAAIDSVRGR